MAVRHRIETHGAVGPRPVPARRWSTILLGVLAVVALVLSVVLLFAGLTSAAIIVAVVCVAAGWGRSQLAAGGRDGG